MIQLCKTCAQQNGWIWPTGMLWAGNSVLARCSICQREDVVSDQWRIEFMSKDGQPGKIVGNKFIPVSEMSQDQLQEIIDSPQTNSQAALLQAATERMAELKGA